jgi:hypothetical protein
MFTFVMVQSLKVATLLIGEMFAIIIIYERLLLRKRLVLALSNKIYINIKKI